MLVVSIRALLLFLAVFISIRLMGKRELGQLQPFEFVIALMMADLAATPMANTGVPLFHGLIPIAILLIIYLMLSWIMLKNRRARDLICGRPAVVISHGLIQENEMRKMQYNLSDLLEQIHEKGIFSFADVQYAILENSGQLTVIPKAAKRGATLSDLSITAPEESPPWHIILDGEVIPEALAGCGHDKAWLDKRMTQQGYRSPRQVLVASVDSAGKLFIQGKGRGTQLVRENG